jgi:hypothetical protein
VAAKAPNKPQKQPKYSGNNTAANGETSANQENWTLLVTVPASQPRPKPFQPARFPSNDHKAGSSGNSATHARPTAL